MNSKTYPVVKVSDTLSVVVDKEAEINSGDKFIDSTKKIVLCLGGINYKNLDPDIQKILATIGDRIEGLPLIAEVKPQYNIFDELLGYFYAIHSREPNMQPGTYNLISKAIKLCELAKSKYQFTEEQVYEAMAWAIEEADIAEKTNPLLNIDDKDFREKFIQRFDRADIKIKNFIQSLLNPEIESVELEIEWDGSPINSITRAKKILKIHDKGNNIIRPIKFNYK